MDNNQFKGRKGQKRLKELNEKIDNHLQQTDEYARNSEEMQRILMSIPDPIMKEYFVDRYRVLDNYWGGIKTIGFVRLCDRWISRKKLTEMSRSEIDEMFADVLPAEEMQRIRITANGDK